jgi:acyl-CoA synthetase (AMP-forming)/AMP-acid ligase II
MLYQSLLLDRLLKLVERSPDLIVLQNNHVKMTAFQLYNKSKAVALNLSTLNFKKNDIAAIAVPPGEEFLEIMFAVLMLHGKIAIIDPEMGRANYAAKIKQLRPAWLFADSALLLLREHPLLRWLILKFKKNIPNIQFLDDIRIISAGRKMPILKKHIVFSSLLKTCETGSSFVPCDTLYQNLIIYTSGTLNSPKGVLHTDVNLNASITSLSNLLCAGKTDVLGTYLPHFMLLGIACGVTVKVMGEKMNAEKKLQWLKNEGVNIFFGPPAEFMPLIQYCEENNQLMPRQLKHLLIGSAPVHKCFLNKLVNVLPEETKVTCTYGMTELLLVSAIDGRKKIDYAEEGDVLGKPVPGVDIKISGQGEILVRSQQLYSRYFNDKKRDDWHGTGDLGKIDTKGNLVLLGRKKEMIIRCNFNIYPALYEDTIKKIKGVEEAALVGSYDENINDEKVYLAIETKQAEIGKIQRLLTDGNMSIDKHALPDTIFKMAIPRKGRQKKIDRAAIAEYIKKNQL